MKRGVYAALMGVVVAFPAWSQSIQTEGSIETDAQLVSNVERGTAPLVVSSATKVSNLNADQLDGMHANQFALVSELLAAIEALEPRAFYLTASVHVGSGAPGACANGFRMASLWEILDVSNRRYATNAEGENNVHREADSGLGPPAGRFGWIRTGGISVISNPGGLGNCTAWTSSSSGTGTVVRLRTDWEFGGAANAPWEAGSTTCDNDRSVWCVEN